MYMETGILFKVSVFQIIFVHLCLVTKNVVAEMKFVYYIVFASWYVLSLLPLRVLYGVSDLLYFPLFYCVKYRRRIVHKNLVNSFPEKSEKEILHIEKQFYRFFCDYVVETIKLFSMSKKEMMRRMTFGGLDHAILASGNPLRANLSSVIQQGVRPLVSQAPRAIRRG